MKYIKHYESNEPEEEDFIRYNFYYMKELEQLLYKLITKFGVRFFNHEEVSNDTNESGYLVMETNSLSYYIDASEENLQFMGGRSVFDKFNFWSEDGYIRFSIYFSENIIHLRKPVDEIHRRRGYTKEYKRFYTKRKYLTFNIGKGTKSYFNIEDGEKTMKNLKRFAISKIKNPSLIHDPVPAIFKINKN
jgi:hypothetical protein